MRELVTGYEHHPDAHFSQGYWDLKDHVPHLYDEGHFAGEEHGAYHYIEPERTHHMGHYYSYLDDREHHPQHVDQHHDTHGIEHYPDDWRHETPTHWTHHDEYRRLPESYHAGDFELPHHLDGHVDQDYRHDPHDGGYAGDSYSHDVNYHGGTGMMHDIEHEFDELFHELEARTEHGVEHHDIHYTTLHKTGEHAKETGTDFHATPQHLEHPHDYTVDHHPTIVEGTTTYVAEGHHGADHDIALTHDLGSHHSVHGVHGVEHALAAGHDYGYGDHGYYGYEGYGDHGYGDYGYDHEGFVGGHHGFSHALDLGHGVVGAEHAVAVEDPVVLGVHGVEHGLTHGIVGAHDIELAPYHSDLGH